MGRYVVSTCITEEKIQHALELMLLGESYLFGLKSSLLTTAKQQKGKRTCKPVCLSDLLNSDHASDFHKGKLTDFVATQMIHSPLKSQGYSTVVSVLKDLILHTMVLSPKHKVISASESIPVSSSCKMQRTCMSSDQTYFSEAKHDHEPEGDQWQYSTMKKRNVSQADLSSDLSSQSTDLGWFTCDSSVEHAFSSDGDKHSCMDHQSNSLVSVALNLGSDDISSLSTPSENSFRISCADKSVELSLERQMMPNLKHVGKSLQNSTECSKIIMSRDKAHRHENLGEYNHDGHVMTMSSVSLEDNKTGLEVQSFHPERCGQNGHQLYQNIFLIRQDEEGSHSFSPSLNDSLSLVNMAEATSFQGSVGVMKSEPVFLKKSSKVAPGTVKVFKGQNLATADAFSSSKQLKKVQLGAIKIQKIDQMNNSTKSAALQDLNSSMVPEFFGSGQVQNCARQSQRSAWDEDFSFEAYLTMPDSEDISLFLNPVAIEATAAKPCTMTVTQRESQEQYLKENKTFGLHKSQASSSYLKGFHGQEILTIGDNSFANQMIILRDSPVISLKNIQLCRSEAVTSPKIGVTKKQWNEEFTKKTLAANNFYPNDQVRPLKTGQVSSDVTTNQALEGDSVMKGLKHWKYQLSKPPVAKGTFKCNHGDVYLDLGSFHNCDLPVLKDGFLTNKTLQASPSTCIKAPTSSEVPEYKSQIDVLKNTSTAAEHNASQSSLLSKKDVSRQTINPFSSDFVAKEQPQSHHRNDDVDEFCLPFMEPWDLNDSVLVIENEQNESVVNILSGKCQSTQSTHNQNFKENLMQNGQENSSLKIAGIDWSSQPSFLRRHPDKSEKNYPRCTSREDLIEWKRTCSFEFSSLQSGGTGFFNASTDLFNSQSQSNTSNFGIKNDSNIMDCKELEKQTDVSDLDAHMENICNSAAKDLSRYRGYLQSRGSHLTDCSSAKIPTFTQGNQDLMRQEVETPKCLTKKRVRFSRRRSRVSTIPVIDFLMARYPSPANSDHESMLTNTPLRSCLKRKSIKQRESHASLQIPTPDVAQRITPLETSTPLSTTKHWLNSPLNESQVSGFWTSLSLSSKKMKMSQSQACSLKSCGRLTKCCLQKCEQNTDKSCLFCLDIEDKENKVARRQLLQDSEGRETTEHFSEITNQMFKHSFLGSSFEMSPSHITKQTELTTERDTVSSHQKSRQFYANIKKRSIFNTELVSIRQLDFSSDGSFFLFDESDLRNDGHSRSFFKPKRETTITDINSTKDASRDLEIRSSIRTLKLESNSQLSHEQHAQSELSSPSLFSQ